eukprot:PhF_6_TR22236/c0_g1_i3/m.31406
MGDVGDLQAVFPPTIQVLAKLGYLHVPADLLTTSFNVVSPPGTFTIPLSVRKVPRLRIVIAPVGPEKESPFPFMPTMQLSEEESDVIKMTLQVSSSQDGDDEGKEYDVPECNSKADTTQFVDVTDAIDLSSSSHEFYVTVHIHCQYVTSIWSGYLVAFAVSDVVDVASSLVPRIPPAERITSHNNDSLSDGNCTVVRSVSTVSRQSSCPLTLKPIRYFVKGRNCLHDQCYDAESYITHCSQTKRWRCPVCLEKVMFEDLVRFQEEGQKEGEGEESKVNHPGPLSNSVSS